METHPLLFIDWDGTLSNGRFWESFQQTQPSSYNQIQQQLFINNSPLVDAWMRGEKSSEDICRCISERTGITYDVLFTELISSCEQIRFNTELRNIIHSLKKRFRIVLTTDNMDCFTRFTVPVYDLHQLFDDCLISSEIGRLKRDENGQTYLSYTQDNGSDFANTICIDDSRATCELFESLGGRAIKTKNPKDTFRHLRNL